MSIRMRTVQAALAAAVALGLTAAGPIGLTQASGTGDTQRNTGDTQRKSKSSVTKVLPLVPSTPRNNPEGVAWDPRSKTFFVGTVGTGTIYRASLHDSTLRPFITPDPAGPADAAIGMKVSRGKLYVAGGPTGSIYVYSIRNGSLVARFETGQGGFLNDLVVTGQGDVYVTDSVRPMLWHVTGAMVKARSGTPKSIRVGPEIAYTAGKFNLNGIVARRGGKELIVVNTFSKSLYRITLDPKKPAARTIAKIDAPKLAGDGMLIDRGRLLVVTGNPARVTLLKLTRHDLRARVDTVLTDPSLRGPSTIARARNRYLVVNADFAENRQPSTVSILRRSH